MKLLGTGGVGNDALGVGVAETVGSTFGVKFGSRVGVDKDTFAGVVGTADILSSFIVALIGS